MLKKIMHIFIAAVAVAAAATLAVAAPGNGPVDKPVNKGPINPNTWIRGPLYAPPATPTLWNPPLIDFNNGILLTLGTQLTYSLTSYCSKATESVQPSQTTPIGAAHMDYAATWTEMQHSNLDWEEAWAMWGQPCAYYPLGQTIGVSGPHVPGARLSTLLKRDIQKGLDGGMMAVVVPTVDTVEEAQDILDLIYFPPVGHRTYGPSQAATMYASVPGGYRATFNDNVWVMFMIETVLGSSNASAIAALPGVSAEFGATSDLGNFSGFTSGTVDYDLVIRNAYASPHEHGKSGCTSFAFFGRNQSLAADPPAPFQYYFNCFQN